MRRHTSHVAPRHPCGGHSSCYISEFYTHGILGECVKPPNFSHILISDPSSDYSSPAGKGFPRFRPLDPRIIEAIFNAQPTINSAKLITVVQCTSGQSNCRRLLSDLRRRTDKTTYYATWVPDNVFGGLLVYFDPDIDNFVGLVLNRAAVIFLMQHYHF